MMFPLLGQETFLTVIIIAIAIAIAIVMVIVIVIVIVMIIIIYLFIYLPAQKMVMMNWTDSPATKSDKFTNYQMHSWVLSWKSNKVPGIHLPQGASQRYMANGLPPAWGFPGKHLQ